MTALNIINVLKDKRGELATIVALIGLGIVTVGIIAGQQLAKTGPQDTSKAAFTGPGWYTSDNIACTNSNYSRNKFRIYYQVSGCPLAGIQRKSTRNIGAGYCSANGTGTCFIPVGTSSSFNYGSYKDYGSTSCVPAPGAPPVTA